MNWKTEIQLVDLGAEQKLEATCGVCGHSHYPNIHALASKQGMAFDYLDEVERNLVCGKPGCDGKVRIALTHSGETEGFIAGLA